MTVEQSSLSHRVTQRGDDAKTYDTIKEVTGIDNPQVIQEAITACKNNEGSFKVEDVVAMLLGDESDRLAKKQVVKPYRDVTDALPHVTQSQTTRVSGGEAVPSPTQKTEGAGPGAASSKGVIDLTNEPTTDRDELQKAIAASLQDSQGILGGQVTREEQDISRYLDDTMNELSESASPLIEGLPPYPPPNRRTPRPYNPVLEASLAESKAGTKRKRGEVWFVDPLNPHERKRTEGWPVGLKNVGNTCWFSAVIQSLFHLRKFRRIVLNFQPPNDGPSTTTNERRNHRFMHELRHLFALLVGSNKKYVDPSKAVDILKEAFSSPTGASDSQQDVSEFQHKLLEWLEDAFKKDNSDPSSPQEAKAGCSQQEDKKDDNPVVDLFYGQFQAEGYHEGKGFTNEETFGQFPLQVNGFRDIHESLEGATAQGEIEAVSSDVTQKSGQELWFSRLPPVLTFELSRFQFNQQMGRPEKIHNKIEFPKVIYMDRYMERNKALTRQRREEARKLKEELTVLHAKLDKFICYGSGSKRFPLQDVLSSVLQFAESKPSTPSQQSHDVEMESPKPNSVTNCRTESPSSLSVPSVDVTMSSPLPRSPGRPPKPPPDVPSPSPRHVSESELQVLQDCLRRWRTEVETDVRELQENISRLEDQVNSTYSDDAMQKFPYHLHAVLVHEGQAASGHYWAYIYDLTREKWLKFNDITVSESSWEELEKESMGGYHNASAYCLMYVDRTRLEALEGRQRNEQVEALPPDLSDQVMDDNKKFGKELEDWDREMALKKVGGDAEVTDHRRRGDKPAQTTGTQTVHMSQRINLSVVHAQLAMQDTMGIVLNMMEMSAAKPPGELLQSIIMGELRSLAKLEKQFPKKPLDDLRLRMVSLYLFMNGTDEDTQKWVLLEQITYLNRLDHEQRTKSLRAAAQEMMTTIQREKGEQGLRLHEAWHRKYHQFREVVYLFVKGLEAYYKERFAEAMPYFNIAWHYNTEVIEGKSENLGMSKQLVAFYQRECLEKLNAWSAQMFEAEDDISEMLTTMMDLVLPSMPALFLSGFSDDTASAEEMRERWCSFLGQDLDEYKVEKLQEILSKLFEPASETRSVRTPSVRITDMNELYYQYKSIMATADNRGDLDLVLKVT